jgi:malto-oligosyltrehalose synthase/4-alpha-glucanotransferase
MSDVEALGRLAQLYGIELVWDDIWGGRHEVSHSTLRALLAAMRVPAATDVDVHSSLAAHVAGMWTERIPPVLVVRGSALPLTVTLRLTAALDAQPLRWRLDEEGGARHEGVCEPRALEEVERAEVDGVAHVARRLALDVRPAPGYHRLTLSTGERTLAHTLLVVAPETCYLPVAVQGEGRIFGPTAQLYTLRSQRDWGVGDFTDLRLVLEQWSQRGAAIVGLNPLHALFPHDLARASPYSPSSRLFFNVLYLDPEQIEEFHESAEAQRLAVSAEFLARLKALRADELVDYPGVAAVKMQILELLYATFRGHLDTGGARAPEFRVFQAREGEQLHRHALFEALQEHFHRADPNVWGWPVWPEGYRDPAAEAVAQFAQANLSRVEFYEWLQWQCDRQLHSIGLRAYELGLGVGLYGDLAVSIDRSGAEAWANQDLYAISAGVGAPPDHYNPAGQNWGLPPPIPERLRTTGYAPFIATLRANMRHTGALRIDHVMVLMRLYWIPEGTPNAQGAYVHYPLEDLLGILALESQRNQCMVIGEDLGTVPDEMRHAMEDYGVLSYRLLYFERRDGGEFKAPAEYPAAALVAASTHDLPTVAGYWAGRDLQRRLELGLYPNEEAHQQHILERAQERARLLLALQREGLLPPGMTLDPAATPEMTPELMRAVHVYLARAPSKVLMVQLEDVLGTLDQVNVPGTTDQYPNWRRKLPLELERWPGEERFPALCAAIEAQRPRWEAQRPKPAAREVPAARIPGATYRLQLHAGFGFRAATGLVPYLAALGVSHVYCSPYLRARAGSTHGYDIIDHNALNPEIGSPEEFEEFVQTLQAHGMGQILDLVPNHMGVMGADNVWWMDVLENGPASVYAEYFDIEWEPLNPALYRKILVPVLGDHYGVALERGEIKLVFEPEAGGFALFYFEHRFPVAPREYPRILERALRALPVQAIDDTSRAEFESLVSAFTHLPPRDASDPEHITERNRDKEVHKRRLAALCRAHPALVEAIEAGLQAINGTPAEGRSFDTLHELLEAQAYWLAYWRVASDEINYRRFFDINDLAALRMENEAVFEATHRLVLELVASGKVQGLRIDHPDGLYDPAQYFQRLQDRIAALIGAPSERRRQRGRGLPVYLVVEKIAAGHERVPESWPIHGTTGYRFTNVVNGVFVDTTARTRIDRIYRSFTGEGAPFEDVVYASKRVILRHALSSELNVLANQLSRIAQADRRTRDFTLNTLRQALTEVIACFPIYRTYISERVSGQDRRYIEWAVARAKQRSQASDISIFDFVLTALLNQPVEAPAPALAQRVRTFAMKFQQITAPVTAKGVEDTSFYRYNRLVSLNEVGGDPDRFGFTLAAFHGASQDRAKRWPHTMLASSTHDSKRSEDVRARINTLSEMPAAWRLSLRRWSRINRSKKVELDDLPAPSANDEYLLYQTLLGSWPDGPLDEAGLAAYRERIEAYMIKAVREAKVHSSWINVNEPYEQAVTGFVQALLGRLQSNLFLDDFLGLQQLVGWLGKLNSLSQTLIRLISPGVPDIFQGTELWDYSLVDPDNRRPVDWMERGALLAQIEPLLTAPPQDRVPQLLAMLQQPEDGRCKLYLIAAALAVRKRCSALFEQGDYAAVMAEGLRARNVVAFARRGPDAGVIAVAPRYFADLCERPGALPLGPQVWGDTSLPLPWLGTDVELTEVISGRPAVVESDAQGVRVPMRELLAAFPVALLEYTRSP